MMSIQQIKDAVSYEHGHAGWQDTLTAPPEVINQLADIAIKNYGYHMRRQLVQELAKSLGHIPGVIAIIEETEFKTYPEEK